MPPPSSRFSPARSAGLTVPALVSIGLLILSPAPPAEAASSHAAPASHGPVPSVVGTSGVGVGGAGVGGVGVGVGVGGVGADPASVWVWPVGPAHVMVRPFIAPTTTYSAGHRGIDIESAEGAEVVAIGPGVVHFAGTVVDRPLVSVRHAGGVISSVEPVVPRVVEGQAVAAGETIGTVAAAHCARACVHLGIRLHGEYVSPLKYLGGLRPSVLLPTRRVGG
jgi:murein DD-endopeptidase MepM/ murein hydrolase activator NlpD